MPATRTTPSTRLDGDLDPSRFANLTPDPAGHAPSLGRLIELARRLAARAEEWEDLVRFDPVERWRHRLRLDRPDGYQAWLLSWLPGQGTGAHDHGSAPAVFVVLRGGLEELAVSPFDGRTRRQQVGAGQLRYWAPRHVRELTNRDPVAAISLHVYRMDGPDDPTGEMSDSW